MSSILTSATAAGLLLGIAHGLTSPVSAGGFVNVESNTASLGLEERLGTVTETHVGYEGPLGSALTYSIQAGPAFVNVPDEGTDTEISGKAVLSADLSEKLNVYGEVSFLTEEREIDEYLPLGFKAGATYSF